MLSNFAFNGFFTGTFFSMLVHLGGGGGLYYWFVKREPPPIVAELDLSMAPLVPTIPNPGGGRATKPAETWTASTRRKPLPAATAVVETKEEVMKQEAATPCVDCPANGEGSGQYIPVEAASRKPRWIKNFITSRDYPAVARQEGKDGRVVLTVLIDAQGRVRDARVLTGSYTVLNEVALSKVREAIFTPAYNEKNKPVSCKVTLPIRFELR